MSKILELVAQVQLTDLNQSQKSFFLPLIPRQPDFFKLLPVSPSTEKRKRQDGTFIRGLHWFVIGGKVYYSKPLLEDWLANQETPQRHWDLLEQVLKSLPSNQPRKPGRRAAA